MLGTPKTENEKRYLSALISGQYCKLLNQDLQTDIANRRDIPDDIKAKISELIRANTMFHQSINELVSLCQQ
jgi:recombinational DNA repair protein (RecF pathway)